MENISSTQAEIYLCVLQNNIKMAKSLLKPQTKLCLAIKADAYGHGAVLCADAAIKAGVEVFAVARAKEGQELRSANIKIPILVLSLCTEQELELVAKYNLIALVGDLQYIKLLDKVANKNGKNSKNPLTVHLAVDTGMGRIGCLKEQAGSLAKEIQNSNCLKLGGVCTHFAVADSLKKQDIEYTKMQYDNFIVAIQNIQKEGISPGTRHCCNTAGIYNLSDYQMDMVRLGIGAYGYYPGDITKEYLLAKGITQKIEPFMALTTTVVAIRDIKKGMCVSYGCEWQAKKDTKIAVLPIGYADGLLRCYAKHLKIAINGKTFSVIGRICMDQCMIEIGNSPVALFDRAVIFGPACSGAAISAQELADKTNTISYEITCSISKRVPRVAKTACN